MLAKPILFEWTCRALPRRPTPHRRSTDRLIDSGEAGVFTGGKGRTTLKPGDYLGEIALIDKGTRMASIIASTELRCYELTSRDFRSLVESNGVVGRKLPQRLVTLQ